MSRLSPAFVLAYHGCDADVAEKIFNGQETVKSSTNDYDWLGSGSYFWESDQDRALRWAKEQVSRSRYKKPALVGAIINLGNCLNLSTQEGVGLLKLAYQSYRQIRMKNGQPLAVNKDPSLIKDGDRVLRRLDNAVIERLHLIVKESGIEAFDTVRGMLREGEPIYAGAGFWERTHVQIAVRNPANVIGYFRPR